LVIDRKGAGANGVADAARAADKGTILASPCPAVPGERAPRFQDVSASPDQAS
jgi:hypothetical protein